MAEAIVEDRPPPSQRFYCHLCTVEIQLTTSDYICPLCSGGFIEELPAPTETSSEDVEMLEANISDSLDTIRDELASLFMYRTGTRPPEAGYTLHDGEQQQGTTSGRVARRNRNAPHFERFDNILLEIIQTLSGGNQTALGNASMFFMGNPGDYAWGHEGLDRIVTQLLNQMETTGPPPLPKDKIDEIPNVEIIQEQVNQKLQCSVCWEDFKLNEYVRKLPCSHVYHENCIVPWLELHGTCPICRKSLTPDAPEVNSRLRNIATGLMRNSRDEQFSDQYSTSNSIASSANTASSTSAPTSSSTSAISNTLPINYQELVRPFVFSQAVEDLLGARTAAQQQHQQQRQSSSPSNSTANLNNAQSSSLQAEASTLSGNSHSNGSVNSDDRNNTNSNNGQTDVYKFEDGNVDYEID